MKRAEPGPMSEAAKRFKKYTQLEHVLNCPGMYVDSPDPESHTAWTLRFDDAGELKLAKEDVVYAPAFFKIFDEVVTNALDASVKDATIKKITITVTDDQVTVHNDGNGEKGIPVEKNHEHDLWVPEMIFGHFLTSSNYEVDKSGTAGTNGLGVKLCIAFSKWAKVAIRSSVNGHTYAQEWENSMATVKPPKVKTPTLENPPGGYVEVSFKPVDRLLENGTISDGLKAVLAKRALDVALAARKDLKVTFNGRKLPAGNLKAYAKLLAPDSTAAVDDSDPNWRVALAHAEESSVHGLVNGVSSVGKHVQYVAEVIARELAPKIKAKRGGKDVAVRPSTILANSVIIVVASVKNPLWTSQVKHELKTCEYKSRYTPPDDFISKLASGPIAAAIIKQETQKASDSAARKTDGRKVATLNIPKLRDAGVSGGPKSKQCTLILTEGDSAMTFAVAGLSVLGFQYYGVFPLRGKLLNTREASVKQISANTEICNIKKILGLQEGVDSVDNLRYGRVIILSDQDADGAHIRGLFINMMHAKWPNIVKSGYICVIPTPIVRVQRGPTVRDFYSVPEYKAWDEAENRAGWRVSYYKGLGGWTSEDARKILKNTQPVRFIDSPETDAAIELAFDKKNIEARKKWITDAVAIPPEPLAYTADIPIHTFINSDLVGFAVYSVERAVPKLMDGLKPSQAKIMHTVLEGGFTSAAKRIKVAQLGARTAEKTHYAHGEKSLFEAIIGLAQGFSGANNVPVLYGDGQFGSRLAMGKDAASERYVHTYLSVAGRALFRDEDKPLLRYRTEDGYTVEPAWFLPVLPLVLLNGCAGIATGFSTFLPPFNPRDVLANVRRFLAGEEFQPMAPWYRGFQGTVEQMDTKYRITGRWTVDGDKVTVTELPIGVSFNSFAEALKEEKSLFHLVSNESTEERVRMVLKFKSVDKAKEVLEAEGGLVKVLDLTRDVSMSNIHLFGADGVIKKYASVLEVLTEWCEHRLKSYGDRRAYLLGKLTEEISVLDNKHRYVEAVRTGDISLAGHEEAGLQALLRKRAFATHAGSYDYLLNLPGRIFTKDKAAALAAELQAARAKRAVLEAKDGKALWVEDLAEVERVI